MSDEKPLQQNSTIRRAKHFDAICDEFELQFSAENRPSIESYLERVDGHEMPTLLVELIAIEMHYRRQNGESITFSEYQTRFPGLSASRLEGTIQHAEQGNSPKTPAADQPTINSPRSITAKGESQLVKYFGDYELLDMIARGGMGVVYRARQVSLNRIVALKMILSGEFASKAEVDRFYSEAKAAALLDHPGIVPIYEVGEYEGKHFFSMTYVEGSSLAAKLNDGPLEPKQAACTMLEVSHAVHYAHEQGVIHRDLKPSNILLDLQGRPRVTDFGLAKRITENTGITLSGQVLGTPSYMPPEQAAGQINTIGPASDVYSLGAVIYSLTTGRPPFQAASSIDTLRQVVEKAPVAPRQLNSAIPRDLETIILKCLEKSLPRRYGTAKELSDELQRFVEGRPIVARPIGRVAKLRRWCRRQPMVASLLAAVFLSLILGIGVSSYFAIKESKEREEQKRQKDIANNSMKQVESAREKEKRQAEITRRNLYVSDAVRIDGLIKESNFVRAKTLLERHIPKSADEEDLRGFDWYYHWQQVSQQKARFEFKRPIEVMDLLADERTLAVGCEGGRAYLLDIASGKVQDTTYSIDDEHWSSIAFVASDRLIGHGLQGSFKLWDLKTAETLATKPSWYGVEYKKDGFDDRVPAAVSEDGTRMICSDLMSNLAIWDLTHMRPRPIPFMNDGLHSHKKNGQVFIQDFILNGEKSKAKRESQGVYYSKDSEKLLPITDSRDYDEFIIRNLADRASTEYSLAGGGGFRIYDKKDDVAIGHPITAVSFSTDSKLVLTGNVLGAFKVWTTEVLEDPSRWTEVTPQSRSLGKLPIRSVSLASHMESFAVCDEKRCWVYRMSDMNTILKVDAKDTSFSVARFVGNDLVAIGTSTGLVDLWRVSDSKLVKRFFAGQGRIREILVDKSQKRLFAASSDGCVVSFELNENPSPLVPQRSSNLMENSSVALLPQTKRLAFRRVESEELVLVDPSNPEQPTGLDLKVLGIIRDTNSHPIIIRERKKGSEIVSMYSGETEINVWSLESMTLINRLDTRQHVDDNGDVHSLTFDLHPLKCLYLTGGRFTAGPKLPYVASPVVYAELCCDERRFATVQQGRVGIQLVLRDIDTGKVLSEVRVLGANLELYSTTLTCLDEQRILVNGVRLRNKGTFDKPGQVLKDDRKAALIWNTSDDSLKIASLSPESSALATSPSAVKGQQYVTNQAKDRAEIGIWDRSTIRILDSNSMSTVVEATPPENGTIEFAQLNPDGKPHAVLAVLKDAALKDFRWAEWNRDLKQWKTDFSWESKDLVTDTTDMRWCFDPALSILYYMQDPANFLRWSTKNGDKLQSLQIPFGSVESFQMTKSGLGIAMQKYNALYNSPWSRTWFTDGIRGQSAAIQSGSSPFNLPLPAAGSWLTEQGVLPQAALGTLPPIRFEGNELELVKPNSQVIISENHSCLVQLQSGVLHYWLLNENQDAESEYVYRYAGTSQSAPAATIVKASLSPNGSKIAISTESELRWTMQPFREWQEIQLNSPPDAKITSIRGSWDNKTFAVGLSNGDVILQDVESGSSKVLSRGHLGAVHDSLWFPDRRSIATTGNDGNIVVWDLSQLEIRMRLEAHKGAVKTLAFDSSKSTLYSGGEDGLIRRWVAAHVFSTEPLLMNRFVAPDPNSRIEEIMAAPSASMIQNRGVVQWLKLLNIRCKVSSFGIGLGLSPLDEQLDAMSVHTISFREFPDVYDDDLARLSGLAELRSLDLSNCKLSAAGIGKLKGLHGLHTLDLSGIDLSGFDFEVLKDSANLRKLTLNRCSISDDQLLSIMRLFPHLSALKVSVSRLSDVSVSKIGTLKKLKTLELASSTISDESFPAIRTLKMLNHLDLSDTKISGDNLSQLESLRWLYELRIKGVSVGDDWISKLVAWESLRYLDVRDSAVTSNGVKAFLNRRSVDIYVSPQLFGKYPEIETLLKLGPLRGRIQVDGKSLDVPNAITALEIGGEITGLTWPIDKNRSEEDLQLLSQLTKLERIEMSYDAIPRIHFPILPRIKGLVELNLDGARTFQKSDVLPNDGDKYIDDEFSVLRNEVPNFRRKLFRPVLEIQQLKKLIVWDLHKSSLSELQKLENLESLNYNSGVPIDILAKELPQLRNLVCPKQSSKELTEAIPYLQSLESLTIPNSADEDFGPNLAKLKNLKRLSIHDFISPADLKKLQAAMPGVTVESTRKY